VSTLVEARDLSVEFRVAARSFGRGRATLRAVDRVSLDVERGELLAIVGESGCGKTTVGRTLIGLQQPSEGTLRYDGGDVTGLTGPALRRFRRRVQMVFQDPYASLNPRMKVSDIVAEPLRIHRIGDRSSRREQARDLLERVGLPQDAGDRFPHAFSGGQRQRVGIARALALRPELIVADEPVSALDVSVQAQVINLLNQLREDLDLTIVMIAHDLAVVRRIATRIAVMHLGQIVELGTTRDIFERPLHPYTQALLSAVPVPDPVAERDRRRVVLRGDLPSPVSPPSGCRFRTRCREAMPVCAAIEPALLPTERQHVACHLVHPQEESAA
jgi:oligopeptide/dipeptide ABC transporter ATP-binding protein